MSIGNIPNLFERVVALLGTPDKSPDFLQLVDDLGEPPNTHYDDLPGTGVHWFTKANFDLTVFEGTFVFVCASSKDDEFQFYGLPDGITSDDRRADVQRKLCSYPTRHGVARRDRPRVDHYVIQGVRVSFWFEATSERMCSVRIDLRTW